MHIDIPLSKSLSEMSLIETKYCRVNVRSQMLPFVDQKNKSQ